MSNQQVKTLCSKVNDKLNIRFDCITNTDANITQFTIQGNVRQQCD